MKERIVIGLLGLKGAGKDTCAAGLVEKHDFVRIAFADALYEEVAQAFGVSVEFLGRRQTKESPLAELSLERCRNEEFQQVVLENDHRIDALLVPRSPRWVLQMWGTEYRRQSRFGTDPYWLNQVITKLDTLPVGQNVVVTDVRFNNEANFIESIPGGVLVRIVRELPAKPSGPADLHPSETELLERTVAFELNNVEGVPEHLKEETNALVERLGICVAKAA